VAANVDLIVVGARDLDSDGRAPLGSSVRHIVRNAPCPVLVVRPTAWHQAAAVAR
jgi:nucleotide-binding universal stress UspA family protein